MYAPKYDNDSNIASEYRDWRGGPMLRESKGEK